VRLGDGRQDALAADGVVSGEDALNEANGADASGGERGVGPLLERRAHARTLADESIDVRLLRVEPRSRRGAQTRRPRPGVDHDERVAMEDAHRAHPIARGPLPEQRERHRVERSGDFDVAVGVDRALTVAKHGNVFAGEGLQRPLLRPRRKCVHTWRRVVP